MRGCGVGEGGVGIKGDLEELSIEGEYIIILEQSIKKQ